MVGTANIPTLTDRGNELFDALFLNRSNSSLENGEYARIAFTQFTSEPAPSIFRSITDKVEAYWKRDESGSDSIALYRDDGTLRCKTNQIQDDDSLQEVYQRRQIKDDYSLHVLLVERNKKNGEADIGLFLTNKNSNLIFVKTFNYETDTRLNYDPIVTAMAERLTHKLNRTSLDATSSKQRLQRLTSLQEVFDIEDLTTAIHTYGPDNVKKETYAVNP